MHEEFPAELEDFIQEEIASGKFRSREEVIAESLRRMQERERKINALREDIQEGIDQLDRGEGIPAEDVFSALRQQFSGQDAP